MCLGDNPAKLSGFFDFKNCELILIREFAPCMIFLIRVYMSSFCLLMEYIDKTTQARLIFHEKKDFIDLRAHVIARLSCSFLSLLLHNEINSRLIKLLPIFCKLFQLIFCYNRFE